ncbi:MULTISPECIES: DUF736 domain-containing protein [Brevundimonas]|uniref:Hypotheical conserved protein n=1 Tax=Brevundimonas abyssalis TAR-001 TaxID=1391729 RepID=A0A8E0NDR4_9CAUL|nr:MULTISPECIES: DUF736 family protein [Brevundimonas]GAD60507.1 hypotheical conserved protein [Brevundimonas abyssalis TAR-001]
MSAIGYVKLDRDTGAYEGAVRTLAINAPLRIVPNGSKAADNQPDYRVYSGNVELGAGWIKTGEQSRREYVSLGLAAPELGPRRIYVNLGRAAGQDDEDVFALIWNPAD